MPPADATRTVALLGPTNTGKTHRAIERMLDHGSGMIGLPLRLLAREIFDRVTARIGQDRVALVTGEEKRVPRRPDYWICTTEAMPMGREVDFLAVDEVQLATHDERGHVFTDRLLNARGRRETWFLGAGSMRAVMERLVPAAQHQTQPRLSRLSFAGASKLSRLRPRSAVVGFSVKELYEIAGRLRRLHGGTALVLGALSPRTRNAQVALFQSGEVDYLVATDAIGMGLNLDLQHVAFASLRKFDGQVARSLDVTEIAQIAGRAGRYLTDGTFGTLAPLSLERDLVERVEMHRFDPVRRVRYRNTDLDYSSPGELIASLKAPPRASYLASAPFAEDLRALETLLGRPDVARHAKDAHGLELLWHVCQIPDFRGILFEVHVDLLHRIFRQLTSGPLDDGFMAQETADLQEMSGDIDTLMARIARLRTWAFVANQSQWLLDPAGWQARLRDMEDALSDSLHASLVARFVERRARTRPHARPSPRQRTAAEPRAEVDRNHPFASLDTLRDKLSDARGEPAEPAELQLEGLLDAPHESFQLRPGGEIWAADVLLARLVRGSSIALPDVRLVQPESLGAGLRSRLQRRLLAFARDVVGRLLQVPRELSRSPSGALRAIAYQLEQGLGTASVAELESSLRSLDEAAASDLQRLRVRVGVAGVFVAPLLQSRHLAERAILLESFEPGVQVPESLGRPSYATTSLGARPESWLSIGYVPLGPRAIRIDLLERALTAVSDGGAIEEALIELGIPRKERSRTARAIERFFEVPRHKTFVR